MSASIPSLGNRPRRVAPAPPPRRPHVQQSGGSIGHPHEPECVKTANEPAPLRKVPPIPTLPSRASTTGGAPTQNNVEPNPADREKMRLLARKPPPIPVALPTESTTLAEVQHTSKRVQGDYHQCIPPPRPVKKPALPQRKINQEASSPESNPPSSGGQTPGLHRRLPPPLIRGSTPPPPPPVNLSTKPILLAPSPESLECCIKCCDFSAVDHHASLFPQDTVSSLQSLARDLTAPFASETEKARVIFTWLSHTIVYDVQAFLTGNIHAASPEQTLHSGKAVCDGYAGLFQRLLELAGIRQATKVTGHGKGFGYKPPAPASEQQRQVRLPQPESNHAWTRACLDGEWRLIDPCWGAGSLSGTTWDQHLNPYWFTADPVKFGEQHFPMVGGIENHCLQAGRSRSWEEYITMAQRPNICGEFHTLNLDVQSLQPGFVEDVPAGGGRLTFRVAKRCPHLSTAEQDNYLLLLFCSSDSRMTPMLTDNRGGWCATIHVPPGSDVILFYVKTMNSRDGGRVRWVPLDPIFPPCHVTSTDMSGVVA